MANTCSICLENYTLLLRAKVTCPYCPSHSCRGCVQRYLLTSYDDPHCMGCRKAWNREFIDTHLTKTFRSGTLRKHRAKILCDREKSLLPAMQVFVQATVSLRSARKEYGLLFREETALVTKRSQLIAERDGLIRKYRAEKVEEARENIKEELVKKNGYALAEINANRDILNIQLSDANAQLIRFGNILAGRGDTTERVEAREFIQRCPAEGCRGYLSTAYKCGTCSKYACSECLEVKGLVRDVEHTCKEDAKATAALIRRETKPCPKCGVRIYKIDGCFIKDTPILMWDGSIKMSQDISVGDVLVGDDGLSRTVTDLFSGGDEMYEVSQKSGVSYTVNSKHTLALKFSGDRKIYWSTADNSWKMSWFDHETHVMKHAAEVVSDTRSSEVARASLEEIKASIKFPSVVEITVDDYMKLSKSSKTSLMGFKAQGIQWPRKQLRLDPYMMGLWLGDGINDGMSFAVSSESDPEIIQYLLNWCNEHGAELVHDETYRFRVRRRGSGDRLAIGYGATSKNCSGCSMKKSSCCDIPSKPYMNEAESLQKNPLKEALDSYGLTRQKFIPTDFLVNDRENRLQLLAGLIDTDGFVGNDGKRIQIAQANHSLARQIEMLARSLGFAVTVGLIKKTNIVFNGGEPKDYPDHLGLNISGDHLSEIPCRIARKKCVSSAANKDQMRTGIQLKPVGRGTYYGWSVTDNKRFLLPDMTVVRNCDQMWCTQEGCQTAFSWTTGRVVTGTIHNPHYYEFLRQRGNGAAPPREAGDIPCGGIPVTYPFTRMIAATALPLPEKAVIYNVHRCINDIVNARLPDYLQRRPANANMDINILYLMNEMDEDTWKKMLEQRETRFERKKEIGQILQMFGHVGAEFLRALERAGATRAGEVWIGQVKDQVVDLRTYTNKSLAELGKRMMCAFPQIDKDWFYVPPRKDAVNDNPAPVVPVAPALAPMVVE